MEPNTPISPTNPSFTPPTTQPSAQPTAPQWQPPIRKEKSSVGVVIGSVIVILVLIVVGFYFWGQKLNQSPMTQTVESNMPAASNDSIASIEESLVNIDAETLDLDFSGIDAEL